MSMPDLNSGALAPVSTEQSLRELHVSGQIPGDLSGSLLRNGPNPLSGKFTGNGVLNWWPEASMLHAIRLGGSKAISYSNRWARTRAWAEFGNRSDAQLYPPTNPNVNVIAWADELLALGEGSQPVAIRPELNDLTQQSALTAVFADGVTAHPKIDPSTGELRSFRAHWEAPFLIYQVHDAAAGLLHKNSIEMSAPAMLHDMAITKHYSLLLETGVGYDFSLFAKGMRIPLSWQSQPESRIALIPRLGGKVQWLRVEPCFMQHVINAFETADNRIMFDVMRYPHYFVLNPEQNGYEPNPLALPWRYEINLANGSVRESALSDVAMELPRINEARTGTDYRYAYAVAQPSSAEMRGICKLDTRSGDLVVHELPPGDQNSEPVFVAAPDAAGTAPEDRGWVLACVYRHASDTTDLIILNAEDIAAPPVATIHLPLRIPAGFHGAWVPD